MPKGTVDPGTLQQWLKDGSAILVDVREPAEYRASHIRDARLMPLSGLDARELPRSHKIVVHCVKGGRGDAACEKLLKQEPGLEVFNLEGGLEGWTRAGLSVEQGEQRVPMDGNIKKKILTLLDQHRIMTVATLRPDGWPQATTVGYVNEGLTLYFLCGLDSQKANNLARDNRISLTIDHDAPQIMDISGLSMAARAQAVTDRAEAEKVLQMLPLKYPQQMSMPFSTPKPEDVRIFRLVPEVISVLDYSKGFGHTDLVTC